MAVVFCCYRPAKAIRAHISFTHGCWFEAVGQLFPKIIGKDFTKSNETEKLSILREISSGKSQNEDLKYFLAETRRWTIKGYDTSQYVMTKLVPYEMIPGHFHGCVKINK